MVIPAEFQRSDGPPVALITGAGRRIGASLAHVLAEDGWRVVVHVNRSREEGEALAARIGGEVVTGDLEDAAVAASLVDLCPAPPQLLINNASRFDEDQLLDFDVAQWERHMAINLRAPALLTQAFARRLPGDAGGMIVNLLDAKLSALNPDFFTYTISKYGLQGLTELSARALAPNIRVNAIAPSITLVSGPQSRDNFDVAHVHNPLGRGLDIAHLANALRYLIATPTVTGQTLTLDSGVRFWSMPRDVAYMVPE